MKNAVTILIFVLTFAFLVAAQTNPDSSCPTVGVRGGGLAGPNETTYFTADVDKNGKALKIEYIWTVRGGKIIEGQGKETVKVEVLEDGYLSAAVEIKGFPEGCPNSASEAITIKTEYRTFLVDEYEKIPFTEEKNRLAKIDLESLNKSFGKLYFVINLTGKQTLADIKSRVLKIKNYLIETLKIPKDRIVFVFTDSSYQGYRTKIYIVPVADRPPELRDEIEIDVNP